MPKHNFKAAVWFAFLAILGGVPMLRADGPDVIVGDLQDIGNYSPSSGIDAFSVGTTACNMGDEPLVWRDFSNKHPVIAQNMYRLKNDRFEQIGMSWLKHGFAALQETECSNDCEPYMDSSSLGVGCSDPYTAGLNGTQEVLGMRSEVNPATGEFPFPPDDPSYSGSIARRLQVHVADLDPSLNVGALYFVEGQYVHPVDAADDNDNNNASYRRVTISTVTDGADYNATLAGDTTREAAAIEAWQAQNEQVTLVDVDVESDGRFIIAYLISDNGDCTWHYEYAIYNMNSDRGAASFRVPIATDANVTNVEFHDVDYHSGEPFDGTDWESAVNTTTVSWQLGETFDENEDANSLRWGTLYNFRFDCDSAPVDGDLTLGLFKPAAAGTGPDEVAFEGSADCCQERTRQVAAWAADDSIADDHFGCALSVSGEVLAIGARSVDEAALNAGAVYVFGRTGSTWTQETKLVPEDGGIGDEFGSAVAAAGELLLVGARLAEGDEDHNAGAAYLYRRSGDSWIAEQKLSVTTGEPQGQFGSAVALSEEIAVVSAVLDGGEEDGNGAAYVFRYDGSSWVKEARLAASDGFALDQFGSALAICGDVIAVGARAHDAAGQNAGAIYIFEFDGSKWNEMQKLVASDGADLDNLGASIALDGELLIAGARLTDEGGSNAGAAYVYRHDGQKWSEEQKLQAPDASADAHFGTAVAISGDYVLVGAPGDRDDRGAIYLYSYAGGEWSYETKWIDRTAAGGEALGSAVSVEGTNLFAGAPDDATLGSVTGKVLWARLADCNRNDIPDACEIQDGSAADEDGDGQIDACTQHGECPVTTPVPVPRFLRGDCNGDGAVVTIMDALFVLTWQFLDGPTPPCLHAADVDGNGVASGLIDGLYLLKWGYLGGEAPPAPGPAHCGPEPYADVKTLGCNTTPPGCE